jgi:hypothetical protein
MALTFPLQAIDPLQIAGEPAWAAPFSLFASMTLFCATVLWFGDRMEGSVVFARAGLAVAVVAIVEPWLSALRVVLEPRPNLGAHLATLMVAAHLGLFIASAALAVDMFRRNLGHPTVAWSIRLGMILTLCGLVMDPARGLPALIGGGDNWGPAHVVALHGVQVLPVAGWLLSRRRDLRVPHQITLVAVTAVSYTGVMLVLGWQAMRGQAALSPDPLTVAALVVVIAGGASSTASVLAHAREVQHLALEARTASERRMALAAQAAMARARRVALQQRVTQGLLKQARSGQDRAMPGVTHRIRHPIERLAPDERPTEIELLPV